MKAILFQYFTHPIQPPPAQRKPLSADNEGVLCSADEMLSIIVSVKMNNATPQLLEQLLAAESQQTRIRTQKKPIISNSAPTCDIGQKCSSQRRVWGKSTSRGSGLGKNWKLSQLLPENVTCEFIHLFRMPLFNCIFAQLESCFRDHQQVVILR